MNQPISSLSALALLGGAIGGATAHNPPIELRRRRLLSSFKKGAHSLSSFTNK